MPGACPTAYLGCNRESLGQLLREVVGTCREKDFCADFENGCILLLYKWEISVFHSLLHIDEWLHEDMRLKKI